MDIIGSSERVGDNIVTTAKADSFSKFSNDLPNTHLSGEGYVQTIKPINPAQPARQTLAGMGFDDSKIGYDADKNHVTYNGKPILSGGTNRDGTIFASKDAIGRGAADYLTSEGYQPVRQALQDRGISDSRIGWNNNTGMITIDGRDAFKPSYNVNGTTYADEATLNNLASTAYNNVGNPLMGVRDYVTSKGFGGAVDWDGQNVLVGGQSIRPAFVRDGTAYVPKSTLDDAISAYKDKNGITGNKEVADNYNDRYGGRLEELLRPLVERREFSYDPDNDEAFQRYRQLMIENADDAYRLELNRRGNTDGAAMYAALASRNDYLRQADAALGEYYDRAHDVYESETTRRRNNLSDAYNLFNDFYNKQYQANRDQIGDTFTANQLANSERQQDFENDQRLLRTPFELNQMRLQNEGLGLQNIGAGISNAQQQEVLRHSGLDNRMSESYSRGFMTPEDAQIWSLDKLLTPDASGRMVNADGSVYRPYMPEIDYNTLLNYANAYVQQAAANQANREFGQLPTQIQSGAVNPYTPVNSDALYALIAPLADAASGTTVQATAPDTTAQAQALLNRLSADPNTAALVQVLQNNPNALTLMSQIAAALTNQQ